MWRAHLNESRLESALTFETAANASVRTLGLTSEALRPADGLAMLVVASGRAAESPLSGADAAIAPAGLSGPGSGSRVSGSTSGGGM
jgi:hypothetical protein